MAAMQRLRTKRTVARWATWDDERLLATRFRDLALDVRSSRVGPCLDAVQTELDRVGIVLRPSYWFADEWFSPAGMTGIGIPFYLAHPRLMRLHRAMGAELEGGSRTWCLKILRHELGHVLDHAFGLSRRRRRQALFGRSSTPYPQTYRPNPYSKAFVQHLYYWYAQSHPDEDFAETFAVWLTPGSNWRTRYRGWPQALAKLEYVDALMQELKGLRPPVQRGGRIDPVHRLTLTLGTYYRRLARAPETLYPDSYDVDLLRLFTAEPTPRGKSAAAFIRSSRREVVELLSFCLAEQRYEVNHVLHDLVGRCRELSLRVDPDRTTRALEVALLVAKHTMSSLYRERRWISL